MRRPLLPFRYLPQTSKRYTTISKTSPPIIRIENATFYRRQPSATTSATPNPAIFPNLSFSLPSSNPENHHYAIVGPSNAGKTTFLNALRGHFLCFPPTGRSYPYLSTDEIAQKDPRLRFAGNAIQYVGFDAKQRGLSGMGTYMAARYESRREATDFSVRDYLEGRTSLNASDDKFLEVNAEMLERVTRKLRLGELLDMPVSNLSNGQTRRARIAKALLGRPEVLLLDEPFMGLDPMTTVQISGLLKSLAEKSDPRLVLALRSQDPIPEWITHVLFLGKELQITHRGPRTEVRKELVAEAEAEAATVEVDSEGPIQIPRNHFIFGRTLTDVGIEDHLDNMTETKKQNYLLAKQRYAKGFRDAATFLRLAKGEQRGRGTQIFKGTQPTIGEPVIEMEGVIVKYGEKIVLGRGKQMDGDTLREEDGLFWTVKRGQRWGIFGPNGSGKTTLLSLLLSDHPQSYSLPIKLFGRSRLPTPGQPGIPLFELQRRIGHSSPELHAFFPKHLTVRATLESAFAATPLSRPTLTISADDRISSFLRWFQPELQPSLGWNKTLASEFAGSGTNARLVHTQAGNPDQYRETYNEYWYDHATSEEASIDWADSTPFSSLSFSAQRMLLFLRAIVARPDIIVLDEPFSGLDEWARDKCLLFLQFGELKRLTPFARWNHSGGEDTTRLDRDSSWGKWRGQKQIADATFRGITDEQALVVVSHLREELPDSVKDWMYLPDLTKTAESVAAEEKARKKEQEKPWEDWLDPHESGISEVDHRRRLDSAKGRRDSIGTFNALTSAQLAAQQHIRTGHIDRMMLRYDHHMWNRIWGLYGYGPDTDAWPQPSREKYKGSGSHQPFRATLDRMRTNYLESLHKKARAAEEAAGIERTEEEWEAIRAKVTNPRERKKVGRQKMEGLEENKWAKLRRVKVAELGLDPHQRNPRGRKRGWKKRVEGNESETHEAKGREEGGSQEDGRP